MPCSFPGCKGAIHTTPPTNLLATIHIFAGCSGRCMYVTPFSRALGSMLMAMSHGVASAEGLQLQAQSFGLPPSSAVPCRWVTGLSTRIMAAPHHQGLLPCHGDDHRL